MFKAVAWSKTHIFTITDISKISQYKTFVYGVDIESWEEEEVWQGSFNSSSQALGNLSYNPTITITSPTASQVSQHIWQAQQNIMANQTSYYTWASVAEDPRIINNMKNGGQIAHTALVSMDKEEISETEYAIFLLKGDMAQVREEE